MKNALSARQRERLEALAQQRGVDVDDLVSEAVEDWLMQQREADWQARLARLLERRRAIAQRSGYDQSEVELDVREALDDARASGRP